MTASQKILLEVDLEKIHFNPYQPRRKFAQDELEGLVRSIQSVGLLHPPLVRPIGEEGEKYLAESIKTLTKLTSVAIKEEVVRVRT